MRPQENEVFQAEVGKGFTLQIEAQDPEGQKLVYMLTEGPRSLTLDRDTGLIQWTPTSVFAGKKVKVTFYVSDRPIGQTAGREVYRTFYIEVQEKADTTPPTVVTTNPANGDLGAPITDTITVTFSEEVRRGTGSVTIIDENNNRIAIQGISVSGCVLTIRLANRLAYSTEYAVGIGAGVVTDLAGNPNPEYSWAFRTRAPQAPPSPGLVAPPNGATVSTTPTLQWNPVSGAKGYAVQVARDSGFGAKVFDQVVSSTSVQVNPALDAGSRYFWRVAAMGEGGSISSWSDVWSFTTRPPSLPDLVVEDVWTEPSPPIASKYTTIGVKIRNQGERDITRTIYLELFFDGVSKGRASINGLAAGATKTSKWQTMKWPSDTNYHTIRCIVDPDNIVAESNETNNARSEQFKAELPPNQPPTCSLSANPRSGKAPLTVTFSMSASDPEGPISAWLLDVDNDGNADFSGTGAPPSTRSYTYTSPGTYTAVLAVSDEDGASAIDNETINVDSENQPPTCSLSASPNSGEAPLTVTFSMRADDPDGKVSLWVLDPDDGSSSYSGQGSPPATKTHTYSTSGTYTAILMVADNNDATAWDSETIVVTAPPRLTFTGLEPSRIETSESTYRATLYATGSNFLNVVQVSFSWSGPDSNSRTWRKGERDWNAGVEVRSDSSMVLKPIVLYNERSTQRKEWHWTVTLKDNTGATASRSFTVIYNPS